MQSGSTLLAASLLCMGSSFCAESKTIQIPEGKLTDHAGLFGDITPSAGPRVIDGYGVFLTGDYLYWTAREDSLEFAVSGANLNNSSTGSVDILPNKRGRKFDPDFKFRSGFKAGIGFSFGHDKWDMCLNYTWFNSQNNNNSTVRDGINPLTNVIPVAMANSYALLNSTSAVWKLNFNVLDGELGRNFYISKFLSLRPFFGLKGTWQTQKYNVNYDFASGTDMSVHNKTSFWALGLRSGVNTAWFLSGTWSLFADMALSALWGVFNIKRSDTAAGTTYYETKEGFHSIKPALEIAAGLRKEAWFCKDRFHLSAQAGWEEQVWFSQNQFDFYTSSRDGDLNLQGFTAKLRFDF